MKLIEKQLINYLKNSDCIDFSKNLSFTKSLSARDFVAISSDSKAYFLWGSCVFLLDKENNIKFSFCGFQTQTTKSRINAFLSAFSFSSSSSSAKIYQKNGQLFFISSAGKFPIDCNKIYAIRNEKPEEVTNM